MDDKLNKAIKNAENEADHLFKNECRASCWMTRQNIKMVQENPIKHRDKFIEMYLGLRK